jgi:hypothetical protein
MGSIAAGGSWAWFYAGMLACTVSCAPKTAPAPVATSPAPAPTPAPVAASEELPQGPGLQILTRACTSCHNLREVTKFKGFYTRPQWRDIVQTMVDYGAGVNEKEIEVLSDYLTAHLGKK